MEAALGTGKLGFNCLSVQPIIADVKETKRSDFEDILKKITGNHEKEEVNGKRDVQNRDEIKGKTEDIKDSEKLKGQEEQETTEETVSEEVKPEKETGNDKVKDKKNTKNKKDGTEQRETILDKLNDLLLKMDVKIEQKDAEQKNSEQKDVGEKVDEVGPQLVETETITLNLKDVEDTEGKSKETVSLDSEEKTEDVENDSENKVSDGVTEKTADLTENFREEDSKNEKKDGDNKKESKIKISNLKSKDDFKNKEIGKDKEDFKLIEEDSLSANDVKNERNDTFDMAEKIDILEQISEKIDVSIFDDKSEMVIKLKPDNLGKLTVQLSLENGNITAKFLAESEKVKAVLESSFQELKNSLEQQGFNIQNLSVSVGNNKNSREFNQQKRTLNMNGIGNIENKGRYANGGYVETIMSEDALGYWPESTVSFSA